MEERAVADSSVPPRTGRGLSARRLHSRVLHPHPEGALRGALPLQQVPHLRPREDGGRGPAQQEGRGELQRPLQDRALR